MSPAIIYGKVDVSPIGICNWVPIESIAASDRPNVTNPMIRPYFCVPLLFPNGNSILERISSSKSQTSQRPNAEAVNAVIQTGIPSPKAMMIEVVTIRELNTADGTKEKYASLLQRILPGLILFPSLK